MGASNIKGITVEISGDSSKFTKALTDIDSSIRQTQGALRDVNKLLKFDPGNTELLTQKQKLLKNAIGETEKRLELLRNEQGNVAQGTAGWDALQREIIETEQKLGQLNDKMREFGSVTGQQLQAAGKKIQDTGNSIKGAGQAFAPVSAAAAGLVGGLGALGYKAVTAADDLNSLSKQTGISTDELQKMQYASELVDVSVDDIVGSMKKMKNNMDSDSESVQAAWTKLGVSVRDASTGEMRPAIDVFYDAIDALSKVENETERDQLAMDLFGKSADNLAGVIDDGGAAFKAYGQQAEDMGLILSGDTLDSLNDINDTIDKTKATVGASLLAIGAALAEQLEPMITSITEKVTAFANKIKEVDPNLLQTIVTIGLVVAAISPVLIILGTLISSVGSIVKNVGLLVGFIQGTLLPALAAISAPVLAVVAVIGSVIAVLVLLYKHNEEFRDKVNEVWAQIQQIISQVVDIILAVIQTFIAVAQAAWQRWGDDIVRIAQTVWNLIYTVISTAIVLIQDILNIVMAAIQGDWEGVWNGIQKFAGDIWEGIKTIVNTAIEAVKTTVDTIMNAIKALWETLWTAIKDKLTEVWENIHTVVTTKVTEVKDAIVNAVTEAVNFMKDLPGKALQWGKDLIGNFVDGIKSAWNSLKDTVSDVAEGIADFLGFSEPKKGPLSNFHTYAPDMMALYAKGIKDNMYLVTDQMNALADSMAASAQRPASIYLTNNTVLNGRVIASAVNEELGFLL